MNLTSYRPANLVPAGLVPSGLLGLLDELLSGPVPQLAPLAPLARFAPALVPLPARLTYEGDEAVLRVELPGLAPGDVSVVLDQGAVDVTATSGTTVRRVRVTVPGVDAANVRAGMADGLLELRMALGLPAVVEVAATLPEPSVVVPPMTAPAPETATTGSGPARTAPAKKAAAKKAPVKKAATKKAPARKPDDGTAEDA